MKTLSTFLILAALATAQSRFDRPINRNTVIDSPGSYILMRDLTATAAEPGLIIRSNNVTLDLNGFQIAGMGNNTGTGILVDASSGVRVMNGTVRDTGFGVTVMNSSAVRLEGLTIVGRGLAVSAPPPEVGIMLVNSRSSVITRNTITGVGLGIFVRGPGSIANRIHDNSIAATSNGVFGICYNPAPGMIGGPRGDTVERNVVYGFRTAIQVAVGGPNVFKNNTLFYTMMAFEVAAGVVAQDIDNTKVQLP